MQNKPSFSRTEPSWGASAPAPGVRSIAREQAQSQVPFSPTRIQAPGPAQRSEAPARRRLPGWLLGLIVVAGLCVVALLLALMVQVASDQVRRNQQQPVTRIIGR